MRLRYSRWTGTQEPFPAQVTAASVLEDLGDDLLGGMRPDAALQRLLRRGLSGRARGLDDLRRDLQRARSRDLERMGLDRPLDRVADRLAEIVALERTALDFADADSAEQRREFLDALPDDVAGRLSQLERYDWLDGRAASEFAALLDEVRADISQATFGRLASGLAGMTAADHERMRNFLADLNDLIARRERGEEIDFDAFARRHAEVLAGLGTDGGPESLDELLEELARRMAAMSRLLAGLAPEQRAELAALAERVLDDLDLADQTAQLEQALQRRFPNLSWGDPLSGAPAGPTDGSVSTAVGWVEHLQEYEDLAAALDQSYPGARLDDIDTEAVQRLLGDEAARDLTALREVERVLEESGAARRQHGTLNLTSRGIRHLGEAALARIYERALRGGAGSHEARSAGGDGELTGATRPLRFGDPFRLDVGRTIANGIRRAGPSRTQTDRHDSRKAVRLEPEDLELAEAEQRVRAATVLLLDMSFSMPLRGNWVPAKRVALALHALVSTRFPEDHLYVVGFSDYARRLQPQDLLASGWERVYGTNMQHAFMIARRLLAAHPGTDQHVIMVTDGEPTAHLEGDVPLFAWPPEPRTLHLTMVEAARLARTGATLNVFLLDHDPGAAAFVERMARQFKGRIFYPNPEDLGGVVVQDFLSRRSG